MDVFFIIAIIDLKYTFKIYNILVCIYLILILQDVNNTTTMQINEFKHIIS